MKIEVVDSPESHLAEFFEKKIEEFNLARWEVKRKQPLAIKVSNDQGVIVAGAAGKTFGLWLLIDNIWVDESLRGKNMGTQILEKLESAAKSRGCAYALLDTLNFQARPFYEKRGYSVQWTQKHYPKDGAKYFMVKEL